MKIDNIVIIPSGFTPIDIIPTPPPPPPPPPPPLDQDGYFLLVPSHDNILDWWLNDPDLLPTGYSPPPPPPSEDGYFLLVPSNNNILFWWLNEPDDY